MIVRELIRELTYYDMDTEIALVGLKSDEDTKIIVEDLGGQCSIDYGNALESDWD